MKGTVIHQGTVIALENGICVKEYVTSQILSAPPYQYSRFVHIIWHIFVKYEPETLHDIHANAAKMVWALPQPSGIYRYTPRFRTAVR